MNANVGAFIAIAGTIIIIGLLIRNAGGTASIVNATGGQTANIINALEFANVNAKGGH